MARVLTATGDTDAKIAKDMEAELRQIAKETGAPRIATLEAERRAAERAKTTPTIGHMARGLGGRDAPHCGKALRDNRARAKAVAATTAPVPKPAATATAAKREARAARAAAKPVQGDQRTLTTAHGVTWGAAGSKRRAAWDHAVAASTVGEYLAAGGPAKYVARWASAGLVTLGK